MKLTLHLTSSSTLKSTQSHPLNFQYNGNIYRLYKWKKSRLSSHYSYLHEKSTYSQGDLSHLSRYSLKAFGISPNLHFRSILRKSNYPKSTSNSYRIETTTLCVLESLYLCLPTVKHLHTYFLFKFYGRDVFLLRQIRLFLFCTLLNSSTLTSSLYETSVKNAPRSHHTLLIMNTNLV